MYPQLDNRVQIRLNEFNGTKSYCTDKIRKREFNRLIIFTKFCLFLSTTFYINNILQGYTKLILYSLLFSIHCLLLFIFLSIAQIFLCLVIVIFMCLYVCKELVVFLLFYLLLLAELVEQQAQQNRITKTALKPMRKKKKQSNFSIGKK